MALENIQLRSQVSKSGELKLSLVNLPVADPAPDEIVVRIEGTPINPSDLGLLIGPADVATLKEAVEFSKKYGTYLGVSYGFVSGMMSTVIPHEARAVGL